MSSVARPSAPRPVIVKDPATAGGDPNVVDEARLRQDLELDSLDFLRVLETIAERTGVDVPESAYGEVATVGGLVGYLAARG